MIYIPIFVNIVLLLLFGYRYLFFSLWYNLVPEGCLFFCPRIGGQSKNKDAAKNTLASEDGEEDFPPASKEVLERTDRRQSKFAETIDGLRSGL